MMKAIVHEECVYTNMCPYVVLVYVCVHIYVYVYIYIYIYIHEYTPG